MSVEKSSLTRIKNKFRQSKNDIVQSPAINTNDFPQTMYGIITAEEWRKQHEKKMGVSAGNQETNQDKDNVKMKKRKKKKKRKKIVLSFDLNEDEEEDEIQPKKKIKIMKCNDQDIETDFLPDAEKEKEEEERRQQLRKEWTERQEAMKNETLEITYSYWDGSGHRKKIQMKKKSTVLEFLNAACNELRDKYREIRFLQGANLLYIKEDVILPHDLTFYELIITKARGLTGPLFHFDVHEDIRLKGNAKIDKDDSHPGKIVTAKWYQRNKHIHPYSRWIYYMRPT